MSLIVIITSQRGPTRQTHAGNGCGDDQDHGDGYGDGYVNGHGNRPLAVHVVVAAT